MECARKIIAVIAIVLSFSPIQPAYAWNDHISDIPSGAITGTVTDKDTGAPISNVWVAVWDYAIEFQKETRTDITGNYYLNGIPVGSNYTVWANGDNLGYCNECVEGFAIDDNETEIHDFQLKAFNAYINGHVTDANSELPISGINVGVFNGIYKNYALTDEQGYYWMGIVAGAGYTIETYAYTAEYWDCSIDDIIIMENKTQEFNFRLKPFLYGDVNGDETVNVIDVVILMRVIAGLTQPTSYAQLIAGNVYMDDYLDLQDAIIILRHIIGLVPTLPYEPTTTLQEVEQSHLTVCTNRQSRKTTPYTKGHL